MEVLVSLLGGVSTVSALLTFSPLLEEESHSSIEDVRISSFVLLLLLVDTVESLDTLPWELEVWLSPEVDTEWIRSFEVDTLS
ncbi:UNVERIFIED_CONTAM: hypothetical protein BEN50_01195 [Euhalothece sp. KZN 001]